MLGILYAYRKAATEADEAEFELAKAAITLEEAGGRPTVNIFPVIDKITDCPSNTVRRPRSDQVTRLYFPHGQTLPARVAIT